MSLEQEQALCYVQHSRIHAHLAQLATKEEQDKFLYSPPKKPSQKKTPNPTPFEDVDFERRYYSKN
jgi:uncharacterized protein YciI